MSQAPEVDSGAVGSVTLAIPNEMNLVWIDMEMTGLNPDTARFIELAAIVTDA
jgi:oligoribonuclease